MQTIQTSRPAGTQSNKWAASKVAAITAIGFAGASAQAAAVDVAAVVTDIGAQIAPITAIGGAVLTVFVAIKAFKWVRRALS